MIQGEGNQLDELRCDQTVRVVVLLVESFRDTCWACPVAAPVHGAYGTERSALDDLERFLEALFSRSRPDAWTRLRVPNEAALTMIETVVERADLPRRNRSDAPISFPVVLLPTPEGSTWAMLPTLRHTVHVAAGEDLEEVLRREVRRVIAAQDLSAWDHVGLLPVREHRLLVLDVPLDLGDRKRGGMRALAAVARRKLAVEALEPVATPLHIERKRWTLPPLVGREAQLRDLMALMEGEERTAVLLSGPGQAGKSALAQTWIAQTGRLVYKTSGARLVAGMSGLGQWEARAQAVMRALEELDAVLYLEDLEDLLAERVEGGGIDVTAAIRPYLQDGKVRLLAEVCSDRVDDLERRNWAVFAALTRIAVDPLSPDDTRRALAVRAAHDARTNPEGPRFTDEALEAMVELTERYVPYESFPGKAMRPYLDLRGERSSHGLVDPNAAPIGKDDVYARFSVFTGLPLGLLRDDLRLSVRDVADRLRRELIGQDAAVWALAETIAVIKARLQPAGKPLATFLFVGPTGVGKTELARALSRYLFGSPDRLARFDMSEFMTSDAAERLIRGTDAADGLLTRRVREQPFSVILLDEIEKAHPAVFDLLLQVCGEGRLTDARGQTAWFHNAIIIMTSNLGARERRTRVGFGEEQELDTAYYTRLVHGAFRPEFVNRIDRIVPFAPLSREEIVDIAKLAVGRLAARPGLIDRGMSLDVSDAALRRLAFDGYDVRYGARALRRHLDGVVVAPLARMLSKLGPVVDDAIVSVRTTQEPRVRGADVLHSMTFGGFAFTLTRSREPRRLGEQGGIAVVARLRREADGLMRLPTVEEVREQVAYLVAQLAGDTAGADRRVMREMAELRAEHQRLGDVWDPVRIAFEELLTLEELALFAMLTGDADASIGSEAGEALLRMKKALPYVLLALEPHRDEVTLVLEELEPGSFDPWLFMLLDELERRRWQAQLHIDGGARRAEDAWPKDRRWGPPRTLEQVREALVDAPFRNLLLRCRGRFAGVLLALEAGLHTSVQPPRRVASRPSIEEGRVFVHLAAMEFDLDDRQWSHSALTPPKPTTAPRRKRAAPTRELDWSLGEVRVLTRIARFVLDPGTYFAHLEQASLAHLVALESEEGGLQRQDAFLPGLSPDDA
jgi:ATP-dependent Clp protease ATP-binding subunit ClpC